MRKLHLLCCLLCSLLVLGLVSCKKQPEPQKLLFLAIGQSNMVGIGDISSPEDTVVSPRFLNLASTDNPDRKVGEWRVAKPGNCRVTYERPNFLSPTDYFGRTVLEHLAPIDSVAVIQVAVDGCPMRLFDKDLYKGFVDSCQMEWMKAEIASYDGNPYGRLITLAQQAQAQGWTIRGLLIHQGETDAYGPHWPAQVNRVYQNILADLGLNAADVPVLCGEAVGIDQNGVCSHANPTIDRIHEYIPNAYTISSYGCKVSRDNLHFAGVGYRRLGTRYAIKWLQLNGYDVPDDEDSKLQSEMGNPEDAFRVDAYIREDGKLHIASLEPLTSIDIVSYSGAKLGTVEVANNWKFTDIDITPYAGEDRLVLNIHAVNGAVVNKQVNK